MSRDRAPRRPAANAAFSLMEVIVALTILSAGIVGVVSTFALCGRAAGRNFRLADAVALAERQIELAAATPRDRLAASRGKEDRYTWRLTVDEMAHGLVRASVAVEWLDRGKTRTWRLSQILVPRPNADT